MHKLIFNLKRAYFFKLEGVVGYMKKKPNSSIKK